MKPGYVFCPIEGCNKYMIRFFRVQYIPKRIDAHIRQHSLEEIMDYVIHQIAKEKGKNKK